MNGAPLEAALRVVEILRQLQVRHVVVGSVASSLQGVPRATVDADLVVHLEIEHVTDLVAALEPEFYVSEGAVREAIARGTMFNVIHLASGYKVDLHLAGDDAFEQTKLARARDLASLPVATPEDLVLSKLHWFRLGRELSERQWRDVLGLVRMNPQLDEAYLRRWADYLEVADLLERVLAEPG